MLAIQSNGAFNQINHVQAGVFKKPLAAGRESEVSQMGLATITGLGATLALAGAIVFNSPVLLLTGVVLGIASLTLLASMDSDGRHVTMYSDNEPSVIYVDNTVSSPWRWYHWRPSLFSHRSQWGHSSFVDRPVHRPSPVVIRSDNRQIPGRVSRLGQTVRFNNPISSNQRQGVGRSSIRSSPSTSSRRQPVGTSSVIRTSNISAPRQPLGGSFGGGRSGGLGIRSR